MPFQREWKQPNTNPKGVRVPSAGNGYTGGEKPKKIKFITLWKPKHKKGRHK